MLNAGESVITHRRRYPAGAGLASVLRPLLADRGNPRSLAYQLDRLADDLAAIPAATRAERDAEDRAARLRELAARLPGFDDGTLAGAPAGRRDRLGRLLDYAAARLRELGTLIEAAHFAQPAPLHSIDHLRQRHPA